MPMTQESRRIWEIIKGTLTFWTKTDIERWGEPLLCDIFSLIISPLKRSRDSSFTKISIPKWSGSTHCVLFQTRLALFLPQFHHQSYPDEQSIFTLAGVIDVQRDISDPHLKPIYSVGEDSDVNVTHQLELFASSGPLEQRISFLSVKTDWSVEDRTNEWQKVLKSLLLKPCELRPPGARRSFIHSPVFLCNSKLIKRKRQGRWSSSSTARSCQNLDARLRCRLNNCHSLNYNVVW